MKKFQIVILFILVALFVNNTTKAQQVYGPVAVTKNVSNKVYVHLMPWFESKDFSGYWGQHWTMATKNPDNFTSNNQRDIASYYYPMIGPYDSGDPDLIEYQLLLMKLSGIDGVLIDWPGSYDALDYTANRQNAEALIEKLPEVGLQFAIVYEDHNLALSGVSDQLATVQSDMNYVQNNYFGSDQYIKINNQPLLLDFGPQTLQAESNWTTAFSNLNPKPYFLTLWYEHDDAGSNCYGEYAWVYQDDTPYLTHLSNFYQYATNYGLKMGAACPGFNAFYEEGGWGTNQFVIEHNGLSTFKETLDLAINNNSQYIQIATWNDYGEGTIIEPTVESGYGYLTYIQEKLGVSMGQDELELVYELYQQRKEYAGNTDEQARLDQVFDYLVSLQIDAAKELLTGTTTPAEGTSGLAGTYYIQNRKSGQVMDVYYGGTEDGVNIIQYLNNGTTNQQFVLSEVSTGVYSIMNVNSGKMVDVAGNSSDNNANIHQWTSNGCECQHFQAIATDDGYYKLKAMNSGKIIEVVNGSTDVNANVSQYTDNNQTCGQWTLIPVNTESTWSTTIEAENFSSSYGIEVETCNEGGQNVSYINAGDWMSYYDISFPSSGYYTIEYRIATETGGQLSLDLNAGSTVLGTVDIPSSGGWQIWTTVSHTVYVDAGTYNLGVYDASGDWNFNWLKISESSLKSSVINKNTTQKSTSDISIYPVPANDILYVKGINSKCDAIIYDMQGKQLLSTQLNNNQGGINISHLHKGIYFISIITDGTPVTLKFIK